LEDLLEYSIVIDGLHYDPATVANDIGLSPVLELENIQGKTILSEIDIKQAELLLCTTSTLETIMLADLELDVDTCLIIDWQNDIPHAHIMSATAFPDSIRNNPPANIFFGKQNCREDINAELHKAILYLMQKQDLFFEQAQQKLFDEFDWFDFSIFGDLEKLWHVIVPASLLKGLNTQLQTAKAA
jgi:hypothetical protein